MSDSETSHKHIAPALKAAGRSIVEGSRLLREYPITPCTLLAMVGALASRRELERRRQHSHRPVPRLSPSPCSSGL